MNIKSTYSFTGENFHENPCDSIFYILISVSSMNSTLYQPIRESITSR